MKSVCVFCGSSFGNRKEYEAAARATGAAIAPLPFPSPAQVCRHARCQQAALSRKLCAQHRHHRSCRARLFAGSSAQNPAAAAARACDLFAMRDERRVLR